MPTTCCCKKKEEVNNKVENETKPTKAAKLMSSANLQSSFVEKLVANICHISTLSNSQWITAYKGDERRVCQWKETAFTIPLKMTWICSSRSFAPILLTSLGKSSALMLVLALGPIMAQNRGALNERKCKNKHRFKKQCWVSICLTSGLPALSQLQPDLQLELHAFLNVCNRFQKLGTTREARQKFASGALRAVRVRPNRFLVELWTVLPCC